MTIGRSCSRYSSARIAADAEPAAGSVAVAVSEGEVEQVEVQAGVGEQIEDEQGERTMWSLPYRM